MSTSPFPRNWSGDLPQTGGKDRGRKPLPIAVRSVQQQDLASLAEVLVNSFHSKEGLLGLLYPLLRMGIYEDLRSRLRNKSHRYACLVAVHRASPETLNAAHLHQLATVPGVVELFEIPARGRPIGTVEMTVRASHPWHAPQSRGYLYLSNLAVQAEYRCHGVAQQLLQACEQTALDWGFENIYLHVLENNASARRLYRKAGYQLHEVESGLGSWLMGQPKQLFLRKILVKRSMT
ncbi:MAG: GNAT family N-acetyltransferase [Leptolyngbyaceae cyanobacterium CSU_1_4]|nr:GNAT family N-acetyltransferase [Leptolyngbyaceae cyanobacterium CSU_1_4]